MYMSRWVSPSPVLIVPSPSLLLQELEKIKILIKHYDKKLEEINAKESSQNNVSQDLRSLLEAVAETSNEWRAWLNENVETKLEDSDDEDMMEEEED